MEIIRPDTKIDIIRYRGPAALLSVILIAVGAAVLGIRGGPNLGIDFAGGSMVHVRLQRSADTAAVRAALSAAGHVHTDFERGFIAAEVIDYETLAREGSHAHAREHGLIPLQGRDYVVQDGDVIFFRANV